MESVYSIRSLRSILVLLALSTAGCIHTKVITTPIPEERSPTVEEVLNIFREVRKITYVGDKGDYWQTPAETLKLQTGDCEDKAILFQKKLMDHGITSSRIVIGKVSKHEEGPNDQYHAWNEIEMNGKIYIVDTTTGIFFEEKKPDRFRFFSVNSLTINHTFNHKLKKFIKRLPPNERHIEKYFKI